MQSMLQSLYFFTENREGACWYGKEKEFQREKSRVYRDILFISGCNEQLPHPHRYRVVHQMEQLEADYMSQALKQCKSARSAAKCLGMDSSTFIRKRQAYVQKGLMK